MKFRIHPVFAFYCLALIVYGEALMMSAYVIGLILHEMAHADVARRCGYTLDTITFLPYGARVSGDIEGVAPSGEILIALAGPVLNLFLAFVGIALWWLIPDIYTYTYAFVQANIAICIFNLLPVRPLDGGRVLTAILQKYFPSGNIAGIMRSMSIGFAILMSVLSALSIFFGMQLNIIFISMFMSISVVVSFGSDTYHRLLEKTYRSGAVARGMNVRFTAINENIPLSQMIKLLSQKHYNIFIVLDANLKEIYRITETELDFILEKADQGMTISQALKSPLKLPLA